MIRRSYRRHWDIMPRIRPVVSIDPFEIIILTPSENYHGFAAKTHAKDPKQPLQLSGEKLTLVVNK
jgi:hypothetical protein